MRATNFREETQHQDAEEDAVSEARSREEIRSRGTKASAPRTLLGFCALVIGVVPVVAGWWFARPYWIAKNRGVRAYLRGAVLIHAPLGHAELSGADLQEANLAGANLEAALMYGTLLNGANLRGANLGNSTIQGAHLDRAQLGGADLHGVA